MLQSSLCGDAGTPLDFQVDDLAAASPLAEEAGARLLGTYTEPHEEVRIHADPAGHPFCVFVRV